MPSALAPLPRKSACVDPHPLPSSQGTSAPYYEMASAKRRDSTRINVGSALVQNPRPRLIPHHFLAAFHEMYTPPARQVAAHSTAAHAFLFRRERLPKIVSPVESSFQTPLPLARFPESTASPPVTTHSLPASHQFPQHRNLRARFGQKSARPLLPYNRTSIPESHYQWVFQIPQSLAPASTPAYTHLAPRKSCASHPQSTTRRISALVRAPLSSSPHPAK